jgi:hypothetical protein
MNLNLNNRVFVPLTKTISLLAAAQRNATVSAHNVRVTVLFLAFGTKMITVFASLPVLGVAFDPLGHVAPNPTTWVLRIEFSPSPHAGRREEELIDGDVRRSKSPAMDLTLADERNDDLKTVLLLRHFSLGPLKEVDVGVDEENFETIVNQTHVPALLMGEVRRITCTHGIATITWSHVDIVLFRAHWTVLCDGFTSTLTS